MSGPNFNITDRLPARNPFSVVEVFTEKDFGDSSGGVIALTPGVTYELMNNIFTANRFDIAGSDVLSSVGIRSNHRTSDALISTGSGEPLFFNSNPSGDGGLIIQNILITDFTGLSSGRGFMEFTSGNQINSLVILDACTIIGFYNDTDAASILSTRSVFENVILLLENTTRWFNSNTIVLIDAILNVSGGSFNNFPGTANTAFSISSSNPSVGSQITLNQVAIPFNAMELHSNLNDISSLLINNIFVDPFSTGPSGTGIFFNDQTGTVTSVAEGTATPGEQILCTAAGHNILEKDIVFHDNDFADINYRGNFLVSEVIAGVSYKVPAIFTSTGTGTWKNVSLTQKDPKIISSGNERIGLPNSMTVSSVRSTRLFEVSGAIGVFVPIVDLSPVFGDFVIDVEERITTDDQSGLATHNGITEIDVEVKYSFDFVHSTGAAQVLEFAITQNGSAVSSSILTFNTGSVNTISTIGTILRLAPDDTVGLVRNNTLTTVTTNISNIRRLITAAG